jgi:hypothetical protein
MQETIKVVYLSTNLFENVTDIYIRGKKNW